MKRNRSSSPAPAAGRSRVSKKAGLRDSKEVREGLGCRCAEAGAILERIEQLIIETKADRLELTDVLKQLLGKI